MTNEKNFLPNNEFTIGFTYKGFRVVSNTPVPELRTHLYELEHESSKAKVMYLSSDDTENLFCISFRTLPPSSNGITHILEHTVLCGSKKFPVRDPFFAMNRRSLNTFMNALTGQDFTCYPASSQVEKDFYNLFEVYLDSVFNPKLDRLSFLQEGHRLEFITPQDPQSPLEFKGIVYNEMKGSLSSPMTRLMEKMGESLYPDVPYGYNSGGDPKEIPHLTHEELVEYHKQHYHPSRSLFFLYGSIPLSRHLDFLIQNAPLDLPPLPKESMPPKQKRFKEPKFVESTYPVARSEYREDSCFISFGWLTCSSLDHLTCLGLSVLESILMETDASVLKLALLQSGLCAQASSSADFELPDVPVIFTMTGCKKENVAPLEACILNTLQQIIKEGIDPKKIEVALHVFELAKSEITGNGSPYGLSLFWRSGLVKQHGGDPLHGLEIHNLFDQLRAKLAEVPRYLESLLQKYFVDNQHLVRILMSPDPECATRESEEEKTQLAQIQSGLTEKQIASIINDSELLHKKQVEEEDISYDCLPLTSLSDAQPTCRIFDLKQTHSNQGSVFTHSVFTNHIGYLDVIRPIPHVDEEDIWLIRLFSYLLTQVGCGNRNYQDNLHYMMEHTGGISVALSLNVQASSQHEYVPSFHIRGKALTTKLPKLAALIYETLVEPNFSERQRIKELILKHATSLEIGFNSSGLRYSMSEGASSYSTPSYLSDSWYGLTYFKNIRQLAKEYDTKEDWFLKKLEGFASSILSSDGVNILLTGDDEMIAQAHENQFWGLLDLPTKPQRPWDLKKETSISSHIFARPIGASVAYSSFVLPVTNYTHPQSPYLSLAAQLLENISLHSQIRERGGAYGAGINFNPMAGTFAFYAYRDPNIASTYVIMKEAILKLVEKGFDEEDLEEAKREIIQGLDAPIAPGSRGEVAYGWWREGKTQEIRQSYRDKILTAEPKDIILALKEQLLPKIDQGSFITYAGSDLITAENAKFHTLGFPGLSQKPL